MRSTDRLLDDVDAFAVTFTNYEKPQLREPILRIVLDPN
jgi:hypothetical protein